MPSVIINNLLKINELVKLSSGDLCSKQTKATTLDDPLTLSQNILFERKIIQIKCKYKVINQFAKKNYFLQLHEGTGWDIYWTDRQFLTPRQLKSMMPYQKINYFPGISILTNKQNLTRRLNLYRRLFPKEYDFFPATCIVKKNSPFSNMTENFDEESHLFEQEIDKENVLETVRTSDTAFEVEKEKTNIQQNKKSEPIQDVTNNFDRNREKRPRCFEKNPIDYFKNQTTHPEDCVKKYSKEVVTTLTNDNEMFIGNKNENYKPIEQIDKRNIDDMKENKLKKMGIKSNSISIPTLRNTKPLHRSCTNKTNSIPGSRILLKDNVKNMVAELNKQYHENKKCDLKKNQPHTESLRISPYNMRGKNADTSGQTSIVSDQETIKETEALIGVEMKRNVDMVLERDHKVDQEGKVSKEKKTNRHEKTERNTTNAENKNVYILKPCDGCQGKGIKLAMNIRDVKNNMEFESMICQKYITNPLLWNGYKFDTRFYVLITSVKQLRIYVYNEGIVRLATEKYEVPNEENLENMFMHLTNYSINKISENFSEDSKLSLEHMNRFLQEKHDIDLKVLYEKINDIIVKTILTGYKPILKEYLNTFKNHVYREACFQLLGFDIILDGQYNPYLLEINKNASLSRPTATDKIIKTNLTRDLFRILNLNESRLRGDILCDNLSYNTYKRRYVDYEINNRGNFNMIYPRCNQEKDARYIID